MQRNAIICIMLSIFLSCLVFSRLHYASECYAPDYLLHFGNGTISYRMILFSIIVAVFWKVLSIMAVAMLLKMGYKIITADSANYNKCFYAAVVSETANVILDCIIFLLVYYKIVECSMATYAGSLLSLFNVAEIEAWLQIPLRLISIQFIVYVFLLVFTTRKSLNLSVVKAFEVVLYSYVFVVFSFMMLSMTYCLIK